MMDVKISRRGILAGFGTAALASAQTPPGRVERWGIYEAHFQAGEGELSAIFRRGNREIRVQGFSDGDGLERIRFMPDSTGEWTFVTNRGARSNFQCVPEAPGNHGPVMVQDPRHFCYADGTPHISVGTTCYGWIHQSEELERRTLRSLQNSPFNKVRMCILPTESDPARRPFESDLSFDVTFFQHLDKRIQELCDSGIQADLILFHPYDRLGYGNLPADLNRKYPHYVVARYAAYRNVWWSIANEYDLVQTKKQPEWDDFFRIVAESDPYGHLRSIHYSRVFYDYTKPWVTHLSLQSDQFEKTGQWQTEYGKPIVFDECKYEGNIDKRWGNLSGHEMMRRFWLGITSGAYVGHGETYHGADGAAWISKGGELLGESPKRIAFLKRIFEEAPSAAMEAVDHPYYPCIAKANSYYLYFFDLHQPAEYEFQLPENAGTFQADLLDPWEMTNTRLEGSYRGKFSLKLPAKPYLAIRFQKSA
ncbi:MAG TPA: DUF4038 domain-containing protein [Bryobacteraceae bacterium]|jgi:hypothetical protein